MVGILTDAHSVSGSASAICKAHVRIHSKPVEMSWLPSIRIDATYDGCKAINIQEAANNTDLLTYASACCETSLKNKISCQNTTTGYEIMSLT
jgi:hypothetical protein